MASRFQSRLVGTIILVSLGVIILPDFLDGKKSHYQEAIAPIPIQPESEINVAEIEISEPIVDETSLPDSPVTAVVNRDSIEVSKADKSDQIAVTVVDKPSSNDYQKSAWIIQLMALKNADNAVKLVEDLRKRGFVASTKKENGFTRVLIGPDVSREKLEKQVVELKKITGAEGQLIKFKPLNP